MAKNFSTYNFTPFNVSENDWSGHDIMQPPSCSQKEQLCRVAVELFSRSRLDVGPESVYADLSSYNHLTWLWLCVAFFTPLCIFGVVGNVATIILFTKFIKRTTTSIFIIALAVVDLSMCAFCLPVWIYRLFYYDITSNIICKLDKFLLYIASPMSALILLVIAVDRFLLIYLVKTNVMTALRAKLIIGVLAVVCVGLAVPELLVYTTVHKLEFCPDDSPVYCDMAVCRDSQDIIPRSTYLRFTDVSLVIFALTSIAIIVMYSLIFLKVYRMYKTMSRWRNNSSGGSHGTCNGSDSTKKFAVEKDELTFASAADEQNNTTIATNTTTSVHNTDKGDNPNEQETLVNSRSPNKKSSATKKKKLPHLRTAVTLLLVTATFIITYGPINVIKVIEEVKNANRNPNSAPDLDNDELIRNTAKYFFYFFFYLNHVTNPIIYAFMNPRFKEILKSLLGRLCLCQRCRS